VKSHLSPFFQTVRNFHLPSTLTLRSTLGAIIPPKAYPNRGCHGSPLVATLAVLTIQMVL